MTAQIFAFPTNAVFMTALELSSLPGQKLKARMALKPPAAAPAVSSIDRITWAVHRCMRAKSGSASRDRYPVIMSESEYCSLLRQRPDVGNITLAIDECMQSKTGSESRKRSMWDARHAVFSARVSTRELVSSGRVSADDYDVWQAMDLAVRRLERVAEQLYDDGDVQASDEWLWSAERLDEAAEMLRKALPSLW